MEGSYRFLQRVWRLAAEHAGSLAAVTAVDQIPGAGGDEKQLIHKIHRTIMKVTDDVERFHLNTAIASIMELVNTGVQIRREGNGRRKSAAQGLH